MHHFLSIIAKTGIERTLEKIGFLVKTIYRHTELFARVANIDVLKWIEKFVRKYEN